MDLRCDLLMDVETLNISESEMRFEVEHISTIDGSVMNFKFGTRCFWQKKDQFALFHTRFLSFSLLIHRAFYHLFCFKYTIAKHFDSKTPNS